MQDLLFQFKLQEALRFRENEYFGRHAACITMALHWSCIYPAAGVGAFHSTRQNSYLGAYVGVGTYLECYGNSIIIVTNKPLIYQYLRHSMTLP